MFPKQHNYWDTIVWSPFPLSIMGGLDPSFQKKTTNTEKITITDKN